MELFDPVGVTIDNQLSFVVAPTADPRPTFSSFPLVFELSLVI